MWKLKAKVAYLVVGLFAGVSYVVACGGSSNAVASVINAIDVVYSNATSALAATNVQAAIDENAAAIAELQNANPALSEQLVGTWNGTKGLSAQTITFNADGTFNADPWGKNGTGTYVVMNNLLILKYEDGYHGVYVAGIADGTLYLPSVAADPFEGQKE